MLDAMLLTAKNEFSGPWDGVIPPESANTLFRMHTFSSTADVKDKGPNAIAVTNSNVTVGSDTHGTYMKFNGTNGFLSFTSSLLNGNSYDVTFIVGDIVFSPSAQYGLTFLDGRPNITNGRYLSFGCHQAKPFRSSITFNGSGSFSTGTVPDEQFPIVMKVSVRQGYFQVYVNNKLIQQVNVADNTMTGSAPWRVGRNAFVSQAATPWLNAKVYYLDFKKV